MLSILTTIVDVILRQIRYFVNLIAIVIGYVFYPSHRGYLPPINDKLLLEPATKLAERIKSGKVIILLFVCFCFISTKRYVNIFVFGMNILPLRHIISVLFECESGYWVSLTE